MSDRNFDAGGVGIHNGNFFGFPWDVNHSDVIILCVPWDATTSYRRGTALGPVAMVNASVQLDFFSFDNPGSPVIRCGTDRSLLEEIKVLNEDTGKMSAEIIAKLEAGTPETDPSLTTLLLHVNDASTHLEKIIFERVSYWLIQGKQVMIAGGEHSVPLGYLKALATRHHDFGILQIDAHADLRQGYEGFAQSHASIMHNALNIPEISRIVQVAVRDVSHNEMVLASANPRVHLFSDAELKAHQFAGGSWFEKCRDIVAALPQKVYVSFDIDGLAPQYCPNTGTPVPGGITPDEAMYLIRMIAESGKTLIGADLCEVAPGKDEWDASVGARILYRMAVLLQHNAQPTIE